MTSRRVGGPKLDTVDRYRVGIEAGKTEDVVLFFQSPGTDRGEVECALRFT
jgi:hypothetical protein